VRWHPPPTRSLHDADPVDEVQRLLRRRGVPASRLTLAVTEGSVMADNTRSVAVLDQLREIGDDIGDDIAVVRAIGGLGSHPGLEVVAEGVEDRRTGSATHPQTAADVTLPVDQAGTSMRGADFPPVSMSLTASPATSGREKW
jgi:hypothetical protein